MKRMLSTVCAALVTVSFAGSVFAVEPAQPTSPSPAAVQTTVQQQAPQGTKQYRKHYKTRRVPKRITTRPAKLPPVR